MKESTKKMVVRNVGFWNFHEHWKPRFYTKTNFLIFSLQLGKWVYTQINKWWVSIVDINTRTILVGIRSKC